jgi:hypothetical protein
MDDKRLKATLTDRYDDRDITVTAEKTGEREGYGWWVGRYSLRADGAAKATEGRAPGHYISAEGALDAALGEARRIADGGDAAAPGPLPGHPGYRAPV